MKRKLQPLSVFIFVFCTLISFSILIYIAYHLAYWRRIYPGVAVANQPVGNKTIDEAISNLKFQISNIETEKLTFFSNEQKWAINLDELNFAYNTSGTAHGAWKVGRSGDLIKDLKAKIQAWRFGINLKMEYQLDFNLLEDQIATIAAQLYSPSIQPQIEVFNGKIEFEQGKTGQELDKRKLILNLTNRLANIDFRQIELPLNQTSSFLTEAQILKTQQRAEKFLAKKLSLVFNESRWDLTENDLVGLLSFENGFDQEKIASLAATFTLTINRPPQNAAFQFEAGKVTQFRPANEGQALDQEKAIQLIKELLKNLESKEEKEKVISLPVTVIPPEITIDQINNLGIKELLGEGISYFWGSIPSRIHNIVLASSALNGVVVPPEATFSFNQTLGEVSPATGYQTAFIIKEGKTIMGDGGGVCQVSTTLFRAALNSGLPIEERHPHSYRVSYYEQGGFGPGFDATVWMPGVDLKIKNDTSAYVLIQTRVDTKTGTLIFQLYGTGDDRQITLSKPKVWDQTPPPPDLYQNDPTLPVGTVKRIERAVWGAKASVDWQVTRGAEILQERTFYSTYQPWQAIYLQGTKQ